MMADHTRIARRAKCQSSRAISAESEADKQRAHCRYGTEAYRLALVRAGHLTASEEDRGKEGFSSP